MTLKDILDEELNMNSISQRLGQLNLSLGELNKKVSENPVLVNSLGKDLGNISKFSNETQKEFQDLVKMQLAQKMQQEKEQKMTQQQAQQQVKSQQNNARLADQTSYANTKTNPSATLANQ